MHRRNNTIAEYHQLAGLPEPEHPLISVIRFETIKPNWTERPQGLVNAFYCIALKRNFTGKLKYGQQPYDFDEGTMAFIAPGQVIGIASDEQPTHTGWLLLIHPDFLWHTPLSKTIRQYDFFDYTVSEALFLSKKEEMIITNLMVGIEQEYQSNIDAFSQRIIIAQLETLLNYADRFYQRQFITRKITNHRILSRLEELLTGYFEDESLLQTGLPTVGYLAEQLNLSPTYLSGLIKTLTGQTTQQHIHGKLIEKAKEKLSTTDLSISEIAYALGFEHPTSFSKLFKTKTTLSPLAFRQSFS